MRYGDDRKFGMDDLNKKIKRDHPYHQTLDLDNDQVRIIDGTKSKQKISLGLLKNKGDAYKISFGAGTHIIGNLRDHILNPAKDDGKPKDNTGKVINWNGSQKVEIYVLNGAYMMSNNPSLGGIHLAGDFPNGVDIINTGIIVGRGGNGGKGANNYGGSPPGGGSPGSAGTVGLFSGISGGVVTIKSRGSIYGGSGGGGGGGGTASFAAGGGGGGGFGGTNGANGGNASGGGGGSGDAQPNKTTPGSGGAGFAARGTGGPGGAGGGLGAGGARGGNSSDNQGPGGAGGGVGPAIVGPVSFIGPRGIIKGSEIDVCELD